MGGSRIRRSGCPGMKRVPGRSKLAFGCHKHRLMHTEEKGRERDNQKSPKYSSNISRYIEKKERMHGKCMNM